MAINRKDFLKAMGGLAALTILPRKVLGGPGHVAPNDQLTKGIIGMGGIGYMANHWSSNERCRLVAVSDCDDNHLERAVRRTKEQLGEDVKGYHFYRDLINDLTSTSFTSLLLHTGTVSCQLRLLRQVRISGVRSL